MLCTPSTRSIIRFVLVSKLQSYSHSFWTFCRDDNSLLLMLSFYSMSLYILFVFMRFKNVFFLFLQYFYTVVLATGMASVLYKPAPAIPRGSLWEPGLTWSDFRWWARLNINQMSTILRLNKRCICLYISGIMTYFVFRPMCKKWTLNIFASLVYSLYCGFWCWRTSVCIIVVINVRKEIKKVKNAFLFLSS